MLSFTSGVVCRIGNLPRGANLAADIAILVASQEFQMQCTQALNISNWSPFAVSQPFPKLDRHAVVAYMHCKRTTACRSLRSWASKSGGENMQFLDKYDKTSLLGQICQQEASCSPGFVEQRFCITKWRGGWGERQPPHLKKHGQRSEHASFLTVDRLFFAIVLALRNSGGGNPLHLQNMDEHKNTNVFLHPSDEIFIAMCFGFFLLCQIAVMCSMLRLPRGANTRI